MPKKMVNVWDFVDFDTINTGKLIEILSQSGYNNLGILSSDFDSIRHNKAVFKIFFDTEDGEEETANVFVAVTDGGHLTADF